MPSFVSTVKSFLFCYDRSHLTWRTAEELTTFSHKVWPNDSIRVNDFSHKVRRYFSKFQNIILLFIIWGRKCDNAIVWMDEKKSYKFQNTILLFIIWWEVCYAIVWMRKSR